MMIFFPLSRKIGIVHCFRNRTNLIILIMSNNSRKKVPVVAAVVAAANIVKVVNFTCVYLFYCYSY